MNSPESSFAPFNGVESPSTSDESLGFADIEMNLLSRTVSRSQRRIHLGPTEFQLLHFLLQHPTRVWSRAELIAVIRPVTEIQPRAVDQYILRLRKALNAHGGENLIRTVRHVGYSLDYSD